MEEVGAVGVQTEAVQHGGIDVQRSSCTGFLLSLRAILQDGCDSKAEEDDQRQFEQCWKRWWVGRKGCPRGGEGGGEVRATMAAKMMLTKSMAKMTEDNTL